MAMALTLHGLPTMRRLPDRLRKLPTMSGPDLVRLLAEMDKVSSAINQRFIDAGRGYERPSDIRAKSLGGADLLAVHYCWFMDCHEQARAEMSRRRTYHGTTRPIKARTL